MKSFRGNIVGRANYTLRDYYHDILFYATSNEIIFEEKEALDWLNVHDLCKCGHEKTAHSKFIDGKFIGCQFCDCKEFRSYYGELHE